MKGEDFIQLALELFHKAALVILVPRFPLLFRCILGGKFGSETFQGALQIIVSNVVLVIILDKASSKLLANCVFLGVSNWNT